MSKENISAPEFAVLPDTADFLVADTPAFDEYAAKRPWIVIGEKFDQEVNRWYTYDQDGVRYYNTRIN